MEEKLSQEADIIDWDACLRICDNDVKFTNEMLALMAKDLEQSKSVLQDAYLKQDHKKIREELHRILGALCYLRLPQLEQALKTFHRIVKAHPQDPKKWALTYESLCVAIEAYLQAWQGLN